MDYCFFLMTLVFVRTPKKKILNSEPNFFLSLRRFVLFFSSLFFLSYLLHLEEVLIAILVRFNHSLNNSTLKRKCIYWLSLVVFLDEK